MDFEALVKLIKHEGCRVLTFANKRELKGDKCKGAFYVAEKGPIISICTKGSSKRRNLSCLLHEFAHFIQWKTGLLGYLDDICDGWDVFEGYLRGISYSQRELEVARNMVLLVEYDAELITLMMAEKLGIDLGPHYRHAIESYITLIRYSFYAKKFPVMAPYKCFKGELPDREKLFSPISQGEIDIMERRKKS